MHLSKEQLLSHCFQTSLSGIPTPPKATAIIAVVMSDRSIGIMHAIFFIAGIPSTQCSVTQGLSEDGKDAGCHLLVFTQTFLGGNNFRPLNASRTLFKSKKL